MRWNARVAVVALLAASAASSAAEAAPPSAPGLWPSLKLEATTWAVDAGDIVTAPLRWDAGEWGKAAGFAAILGGLLAADESIDRQAQAWRSPATNGVSSATTRLGAEGAVGISALLLGGGLVLHDDGMRDTGRDALEAGVISSLLVNLVLKPAFGRERPYQADGETDFDTGSSYASFPSGHTTEAFAVASVVAARSKGWLVPTLSYSLACTVALDRVNDRAHFASDVFAGAVLGTTIGRTIVHRHLPQDDAGPKLTWDLGVTPGGRGLLVTVRF